VYEDKLTTSVKFKLIELRFYNDGCVSFSGVMVVFLTFWVENEKRGAIYLVIEHSIYCRLQRKTIFNIK